MVGFKSLSARSSFLFVLLLFTVLILNVLSADAFADSLPAAARNSIDESPAASILITEVMVKNHATLRDGDGDFPDWVELYNNTGADLNLEGWSITDKVSRSGLVFPAFRLPADTYFVVYASEKDRPEELHAPFALSAGEDLILRSPSGEVVSTLTCPDLDADRSFARQSDGSFSECLYPTPWLENTSASYEIWQDQLGFQTPVVLNEVLVSDPNDQFSPYEGSDWVELKNISSQPVSLDGWYLSDDDDNYRKSPLPAVTLEPGALTVVRCDQLGLSLNSGNEALFLFQKSEGLRDWLVLRDIPYGGSYGRMSDRNGAFFFSAATPNEDNTNGRRRVSTSPVAVTADGIFDGSETVVLDLQAAGKIFYTFDSSLPTESSTLWVGPATIPASCVIRAISVEPGALPSRPITLNYFIGEQFSLPVLSLVTDNKTAFSHMYSVGLKNYECTGNVSFYEDSGSFSIPCGISMHGDTSLILQKKNMSLRFRGSYGNKELNYDLFGGGTGSFTNLVIRAGQDQNASIIRNELCTNLALAASDNIVAGRSRYCILFIDGNYSGIYAITEKMNEQHYANLSGVSKNSVVTVDSEAPRDSDLYLEVFDFCAKHDMSDPENFAHIETLLDIDSLIDWVFLEGYFANSDLTYGNLRFCRSSEDDGRWRFMFYDLDATLSQAYLNQGILLHRNNVQCVQVSSLFADLWKNHDFQARFLTRAAELLAEPLTEEAVLEEIDRLASEIEPEVNRDLSRSRRSYKDWEAAVNSLRSFITENNWTQHNIDAICHELHLTEDVRNRYFAGLLSEPESASIGTPDLPASSPAASPS